MSAVTAAAFKAVLRGEVNVTISVSSGSAKGSSRIGIWTDFSFSNGAKSSVTANGAKSSPSVALWPIHFHLHARAAANVAFPLQSDCGLPSRFTDEVFICCEADPGNAMGQTKNPNQARLGRTHPQKDIAVGCTAIAAMVVNAQEFVDLESFDPASHPDSAGSVNRPAQVVQSAERRSRSD
jgi:hypothetical protein